MKKILVTGGAGFIGFHLIRYISEKYPDCSIISIDNMNDYYDLSLKYNRLEELNKISGSLTFKKIDITDKAKIQDLFNSHEFSCVIHLAAQAGVRYARESPEEYIETNQKGFFNIINTAAEQKVERFLYASSSSIYGANQKMPFKETDKCDTPMSLYAATKLGNELLAASYFYTHKLKTVGMRFFNVYGPWGRPDMAYYKWTEALLKGKEVEIRHNGEMYRDMTYVEDAVIAASKIVFDYNWGEASFDVFNIGNREPVKIIDMLMYIKTKLGIDAMSLVHAEKGVEEPIKTFADTTKLRETFNFVPDTNYRDGLDNFIEWYKEYINS